MFKNFHKNKYNSGPARRQGGVTLIELLVVIFIFMVMSGITIFSYGKFNSSLSVQNLADDIALSVRRAQGYAIGVRGYSNSFSEGYGIHFTTNTYISDLTAGSNKSFILFANMNPGDTYDYNNSGTCGSPTTANECLEVLNITSFDKISEIYVGVGNNEILMSGGMLDIFFKRPNPEPTFCVRNSLNKNTFCDYSNTVSYIKIKISSESTPAVTKIINISNNGQISVL
jgi:type II secretory pathway pseudopilin PulG